QCRIHHRAVGIIHHLLEERPAKAHGDGAVELASALHRVDRLADIGGMNALQGHDLTGHSMNGDTHAMNIEADRARREIGLALGFKPMALGRASSVKISEGYLMVCTKDRIFLE